MEVVANKVDFKKKFTLVPISDIHLGGRSTVDRKFRRLVKWVLNKDDTYVIILGDTVDAVIRQDLRRFTGKKVTDELLNQLDSALNYYRDLAVRELKPLADNGRILGIGEGNHEDALKKHHSFDIVSDICRELKTPFLGYSFLYRLTLNKINRATKNVIIYGHHGWGSSRKTGGAINKRENLAANFEADIMLMGHDHHKFGERVIRLAVTPRGKPKLVHKPMIVAATGSFQRAYAEGETTYAERMGFPPNDIGVVRIDIDIQGETNKKIDMHISE